jgi:hypothetical protein
MAARTLANHLDELLAERRAALRTPLARNEAYMADLDAEIETFRYAVTLDAVTDRAVAQAAVHGKLHG